MSNLPPPPVGPDLDVRDVPLPLSLIVTLLMSTGMDRERAETIARTHCTDDLKDDLAH